MKTDIILAGVGGQGILSIATIIGIAAVNNEIYLKQAEVHGMSQRGGDVQSHLRLSDKPIASDLIAKGKADLIIALEPMEALRYVDMLSKDGWIVTNSKSFVNIDNYPDIDEVYKGIKKIKNHILLDADQIAKDLGSVRSANMVILGAAMSLIDIDKSEFEKAISERFKSKGEKIVNTNIEALNAGEKAAKEYKL